MKQFAGRQSPSYSRVNYILHLKDHLQSNRVNLENMIENLEDWKRQLNGSGASSWNREIGEDLRFLLSEIDRLLEAAQDNRNLVRAQESNTR